MDFSKYGPFANVVGLGLALVATFSFFLLKAFGRIAKWTWLTSDSPPFLVKGAAQMVAVALMALTYVTISASNYRWFGGAAVVCGLAGFVLISIFDRLRKLYVVQVPLVGPDGKQIRDERNGPVYKNIVIGPESKMKPAAKTAYEKAQTTRGGVSLVDFMSGYAGPKGPYQPDAIWDRDVLASKSSGLTTTLMCILLLGVMALFFGAFVLDVYNRQPAKSPGEQTCVHVPDFFSQRSASLADSGK